MKKALCLAAAVLFTIGLTGCDTGPSSSSTAGITETKDTVTAGVTETAKTPTNTVPTQEAAEMLEKTKAALDEFIKIQEKFEY